MNSHRTAVRMMMIVSMLLLTIVEIGPIPITALIGLYITVFKPRWFINLVNILYE